MKKALYAIMIFFCVQSYCHAYTPEADSTQAVLSFRWEADVGAEIFGYRGGLLDQFGRPTAFSFATRAGSVNHGWSFGLRISQVELDDLNFDSNHRVGALERPVHINFTQRNTHYTMELRYDFIKDRRLHPFVDAGITINRMAARLNLYDADIHPEDEGGFIESYDLLLNNHRTFSFGAGVQLNLSGWMGFEPNLQFSSSEYLYLEIRAGYGIGGDTSFVIAKPETGLPVVPPRTSHYLFRRPIASAPIEAFYLRLSLGFRLSG